MGGDRHRAHASDQTQGAQDQGTGEQELEEEPDENGVGSPGRVLLLQSNFLFCYYVVTMLVL